MIGKVIKEISDALVNVYAPQIDAAGEEWEREGGDAKRDRFVVRRFIRAILRDLFGRIGL